MWCVRSLGVVAEAMGMVAARLEVVGVCRSLSDVWRLSKLGFAVSQRIRWAGAPNRCHGVVDLDSYEGTVLVTRPYEDCRHVPRSRACDLQSLALLRSLVCSIHKGRALPPRLLKSSHALRTGSVRNPSGTRSSYLPMPPEHPACSSRAHGARRGRSGTRYFTSKVVRRTLRIS